MHNQIQMGILEIGIRIATVADVVRKFEDREIVN